MGHLVAVLRRTTEFRLGDHTLLVGKGREEIPQQHAEEAETTLGEARYSASELDERRLGQILHTGTWLSVLP